MMHIKEALFVKSSPSLSGCPEPVYPEYAFLGRSNVGKSSLINMITGYNKLAKISGTPGKTQLINHFLINNEWYLTDLPGFGFARVPKAMRAKWEKMIHSYLLKRDNLVTSFLLIDIRHEPLQNDLSFLSWMGNRQLPFTIIFTKSDKLGVNQVKSMVARYQKILAETWEPIPPTIISSSETGRGREEILQLIERCNSAYHLPR
jgi:GTP-binding protein